MSRILITGANGQLGSEIKALRERFPSFEFMFTDVADLDITDSTDLDEKLEAFAPKYIINCAAYTAVDKAESDKELAAKINATAPKLLAEACKRRGMCLIHVSTDYVFDGTAHLPYVEDCETGPDSVYGWTKLDGERFIQANCDDYIIIRTSWLYSAYGNNFVKTMIRLGKERPELGVIFDQIGTPTYAGDLAKAILDIVEKKDNGSVSGDTGIYHYSNEGVCSWYDFAKEIFRYEQISCRVRPIETAEYPTAASRPHYSVLNKKKIKHKYDLSIPHWSESLAVCLKALKVQSSAHS